MRVAIVITGVMVITSQVIGTVRAIAHFIISMRANTAEAIVAITADGGTRTAATLFTNGVTIAATKPRLAERCVTIDAARGMSFAVAVTLSVVTEIDCLVPPSRFSLRDPRGGINSARGDHMLRAILFKWISIGAAQRPLPGH